MTLGVSAQVILTSALAPPVGTKLFFRELNSPAAFNYQRSGENLIWDFSTYPLSIPDSVMYIDPSSTGYQSFFPSAQLAVQLGENETGFIQYSTSDYALQGIVADVGFGPLAMPLTPPLPLFTFPYTYGSNINSTSKTLIKNTGAAFGIAADSVKYLVTMNTARLVRGWGNLILPQASFPGTLLERAITTQTDSMWMKIPFFGWISVPGYPTTTIDSTYNWITGDLLHPYAESGFDDAGQPYYISILSDPSTSIAEITPKLKSLVFPNPANNEIHVKLSNTISVDQIVLYDINGNKMNVWSS
ncbi:MAG: hypothetical protein CVU06_15625, partial [Bacteroidetes bacterium HGW-Bacteroidetes-22]